MLKYPLVDGIYIEKTIVATHTKDVKIAAAATLNDDAALFLGILTTNSIIITLILFEK